jgi:hypothetical protein
MKRIAQLILLNFIFIFPLYSQEKMRIAVMDLKEDGISKQTAKTISNMIRIDLINTDKFAVIERNQIDIILKEQGFQQSGCTDQECGVQIGKLLSAKKIFIGEVAPIGNAIILTVRIVDVEKGISEFAAKEKVENIEDLDNAVGRITAKLIAQIDKAPEQLPYSEKKFVQQKKEISEPITVGGYYSRGIIPGWGQYYAKHTESGFIYLSAFVAAGTFWGYSHWNFQKKKDDYDNLPAGTSQNEIDSKYKAYKAAGKMANISLTIFGITYIANWVDILFFSKPDFNAKTSINEKKRVFINFESTNNKNNSNEGFYLLSVNIKF